MPKSSLANVALLNWPVEMLRVAEREECERLSSLSWDTLRRKHADKILKLSERRVGMRVGHVLMLGQE
jgi:hypothetical protein